MATQSNIVDQNNAMRMYLLATGVRQSKDLGTVTGSIGGTSRIKLFNVGILTSLDIFVDCAYTVATLEAVASHRAPYNLISRVRLTDYNGVDRINLSGFQLYQANCIRARNPVGFNNDGPMAQDTTEASGLGSTLFGGVIGTAAGAGTPKFKFPSIDRTVNTGQHARFLLNIPLAFDPTSDLRGAIFTQTGLGEMYLTIDWNTAIYNNGSYDAVFSGAPTSVVTVTSQPTVRVWQNFIMPQPIGGKLPLPALDLQTVYEWQGNVRSTANLAANTECLINYPNVRTVIGAYVNWLNGTDAQTKTDGTLTGFRLIANANNVLQEYSQLRQQVNQRNYIGGDLSYASYWWLHRDRPIETSMYGNVQLGMTPSTVNAGAAIETAFESFYTLGSMLPGASQGA